MPRGGDPGQSSAGWSRSVQVRDPLSDLPRVRALGRSWLAGYPDITVVDALLIVDSLVSNAVRWGCWPQEVRFHAHDAALLRIEVTSTVCDLPAPPVDLLNTAAMGRWLLEELTRSWGVDRDEHEQTTWADFAVGLSSERLPQPE